jgi:hypothetical protein
MREEGISKGRKLTAVSTKLSKILINQEDDYE